MLTGADAAAVTCADAAQTCIHGHITAAVVHNHHVAVAGLAGGVNNRAVCDAAYGGCGSGDEDAAPCAPASAGCAEASGDAA